MPTLLVKRILRLYCTPVYSVAELHVKKSADTLCDVKALAPVDVLEYMLECKKEDTHAATPEVMCMLTHCSRRWLTG